MPEPVFEVLPSFSLHGRRGSAGVKKDELLAAIEKAMDLSPVHEVVIREIELDIVPSKREITRQLAHRDQRMIALEEQIDDLKARIDQMQAMQSIPSVEQMERMLQGAKEDVHIGALAAIGTMKQMVEMEAVQKRLEARIAELEAERDAR